MVYDNIFYFKKISKIGGTEQFLYEIAKKYYIYDIVVLYDEVDDSQYKRLSKFVRCKKRKKGEIIKCKRAFFNFNIDAIDDIESTENYYCFVAHANFEELGYKPPIDHPKLNHFIGVSKWASEKLKIYAKKYLNKDIEVITCYNPLTLEPKEKILHLVSAGRLDDVVRGAKRNIVLIQALDKYCQEHNRHYIWHVFSNPMDLTFDSPNIAIMKPRVDVRPYIADSDYLINLANDMETYGYSNNEALGYGVKIVTTPLSVNKELNIPTNANLICNWDMSNVDEIVEKMFNDDDNKSFEYKVPDDDWNNILIKGESTYMEEMKMKYLVEALPTFEVVKDNEVGRFRKAGEQWEVNNIRLEQLLGYEKEIIRVIKEIKPDSEKADLKSKAKDVKKRNISK